MQLTIQEFTIRFTLVAEKHFVKSWDTRKLS